MRVLPVTAVIPTCDRPASMRATVESLMQQECMPAEVIVVDASEGSATRQYLETAANRVAAFCTMRWVRAARRGSAAQRNQGVAGATQTTIWFFDDDIIFEAECVARLWHALETDPSLGGVSAMISNQRYAPPGVVSRAFFAFLDGRRQSTFAGRVIGPAVHLLPEDRADLPVVVPVEWLNTTCSMYRREALPSPPFDAIFAAYSVMEDLALSLRVGRTWRLANARTARIFHDSQMTAFKADAEAYAAMESFNRHYVMTEILGRTGVADYFRLFAWDVFQLAALLVRGEARAKVPALIRGKSEAYRRVWGRRSIQPSSGEDGRQP
jgi:GT2 family glycosyltransferase